MDRCSSNCYQAISVFFSNHVICFLHKAACFQKPIGVKPFLLPVCLDGTSKSSLHSFSAGMHVTGSLFCSLGGGQLLHGALPLVFRILMDYSTVIFMTSSSKVCVRASLSISSPLRSSCCSVLRSLILSPNALPGALQIRFLWHTGKAQRVIRSTAVVNSYK